MLVEKQQKKMIAKLERYCRNLESRIFNVELPLEMASFHTDKQYFNIPADDFFIPCQRGMEWSGAKSYCWFKGILKVPERLAGQDLFLYPHIGGYEAMLWVNGRPSGIFTSKININSHGNHYCDLLKQSVSSDEEISVALEYYAHHDFPGVNPLEIESQGNFCYTYSGVDICTKDSLIAESCFDLKTLLEVYRTQENTSFLKGALLNSFLEIHKLTFYDLALISQTELHENLRKIKPILKEALSRTNGSSAPSAGIIGHSHMDTAWLWTQSETIKKCTRTYANQLSLMKQYPEYIFIQSSAYHSEMVRRHYPELFEELKEKVSEGRYEPNGGVWIECDCNLPSGEYIARQFIWGQKYTREHFDYLSDTFWLPDTFGYSAALPQIMKQSGIKYFLTTKIDWNDTNVFPYDTFIWEGLDGSEILSHFNRTHIWPDAEGLYKYVTSAKSGLKEKSVTNRRLISYGYGDGGGGPQFEMIEMARRVSDMEGIPKAEHTTVSNFMQKLEQNVKNPKVYSGELYLELHRGTLTNKHQIKRNNRLAEIALHDLEYLTVQKALAQDQSPDNSLINPLMETLLVNQFHDILPGTCIEEAHVQSLQETTQLIQEAKSQIKKLLTTSEKDYVTLHNTQSYRRNDVFYIPFSGKYLKNLQQQRVQDLTGSEVLAVTGFELAPLSSISIGLTEIADKTEKSVFEYCDGHLLTPYYEVYFDERMFLASLFDKEAEREIRGEGYSLNTFLIAEDVPSAWDNWDIDADIEYKFHDQARLMRSEVVSVGAVEIRIRNFYQLTSKSSLTQDLIFYANRKEIKFETLIDWQDDHRFLKTAFDTTIRANYGRFETQFGYLERPTHRNTAVDQARFEVSNHKYTDISEPDYGVALLNDCKYGISLEKGNIHLSLHKGGNRPDPSGDKGQHFCSYALLPHADAFSAKSVIQPAYSFNYPIQISEGTQEFNSLLDLDKENIIVETIKPLESGEKGYLVRLYESQGSRTKVRLEIPHCKSKTLTNMLEEVESECTSVLEFTPFEIKNVKILF